MTKKEIILLLHKEVALFEETEDENSLGELYISELQFKEAEKLLLELKKQVEEKEKCNNELRKIINKGGKLIVLKDNLCEMYDKTVNIRHPIIAIDSNVVISNCTVGDLKILS